MFMLIDKNDFVALKEPKAAEFLRDEFYGTQAAKSGAEYHHLFLCGHNAIILAIREMRILGFTQRLRYLF